MKEICDPLGALLQIRSIPVGDPTLSVLEIWGAEYQENNAILVSPENLDIVQSIGMYCNNNIYINYFELKALLVYIRSS